MTEEKQSKNPLLAAILKGAGLGILLGLIFAAGYFGRGLIDQTENSSTSFTLLNEIEGLLDRYFLYDLPAEKQLVEGAAAGMVAALNERHTFYTEPESAEISSTDLAGEFGGIGAEVVVNDQGQTVIARAYEDSPAGRAGLEPGDIILMVDEIDVSNGAVDLDGVVSLIRGEVGTDVRLLILRGLERLTFTLTREKVEVPSVIWALSEEDSRVGLIIITQFTARTSDEMGRAITELTALGAEGFILDLRNNGGGLLDAAVDVAGHFLSNEVILYEIEKGGAEQTFRSSRGGDALDIPLVVLINGYSASASEILAGALQDHDRAELIGDRSYGKGTVQVIFDLSDDATLRITNAEWFTPNHNKIEGIGLTPDLEVALEPGGDNQLSAALARLAELLR